MISVDPSSESYTLMHLSQATLRVPDRFTSNQILHLNEDGNMNKITAVGRNAIHQINLGVDINELMWKQKGPT